jgi:hypothetical protein
MLLDAGGDGCGRCAEREKRDEQQQLLERVHQSVPSEPDAGQTSRWRRARYPPPAKPAYAAGGEFVCACRSRRHKTKIGQFGKRDFDKPIP